MSNAKKLMMASAGSEGYTHLYVWRDGSSFCVNISNPSSMSIDSTDPDSIRVGNFPVYNQLTNTVYVQQLDNDGSGSYSFTGANFANKSFNSELKPNNVNQGINARIAVDWVNDKLFSWYLTTGIKIYDISGVEAANATLDGTVSGFTYSNAQAIDPVNERIYFTRTGSNRSRVWDYSNMLSATPSNPVDLANVFTDAGGSCFLDRDLDVLLVQECDDNDIQSLTYSGGSSFSQTSSIDVDGTNTELRNEDRFGAPHDPETLQFTGDYVVFVDNKGNLKKFDYNTSTGALTLNSSYTLGSGNEYIKTTFFDPYTNIFYISGIISGATRLVAFDPETMSEISDLLCGMSDFNMTPAF